MSECVERFKMGDEEAYTVFNGGQGAVVVVDAHLADIFCGLAHRYKIEARSVGYIDKGRRVPQVEIYSSFSGKRFYMR
jgi:phosphoribosylaminoimidazole (AIR) synthetase